ncbi:MAG: rod shape-determining protein RodA [Lachnospiraceae bacterium]|jgi:rod shape determining protein RodA|nr:rod shape-determining protein RodA [Lachnospiraceae bacterium]
MLKQYQLRDFRLRLVVFVYTITILGILVIGSAKEEYQSQQVIGMVLGTIAMLAFALMDYRFMLRFYWLIYLLNMVFLVGVALIGTEVNGSKRWLDLGFLRFQPSELTKLLLILFFAKFFSKYRESISSLKTIIISGILLLIPLYLVKEQPDLSTTLTIAFVFCVLIFVGGLSYKIIGAVLAVLIPSAIIFINLIMQEGQQILDDYQFRRIMAWLNPAEYADDAYQQQNSIIAIGSGQLYGKGLYNNDISSVKNGNFIVEPQTDFIFAVTGEELGFIGCAAVIILLALIVMECLWIAKNSKEREGMIICCGFGGLIAFQSLVNISVATGLMPNTGLPLPFVSYGLTSLVMLYMGIGIVLNVGLQPKKY